jgi:hypothetical protein
LNEYITKLRKIFSEEKLKDCILIIFESKHGIYKFLIKLKRVLWILEA